jgi:SAM-dependent methyltransferase
LHFDLEKDYYAGETFDLLFTQMVLHHIADVDSIITKFVSLLNPGGYIAIADIYPEDGSFHGAGFSGHKGFDPEDLSAKLRHNRFENTAYQNCFTIRKEANGQMKEFDVFLLTGRLMNPKK